MVTLSVQGSAYEGVKLDSAAAADHTAALYCAINETLVRLASRKMYKSGATTLRTSVDRALLMCSQIESGAGYASDINPLYLMLLQRLASLLTVAITDPASAMFCNTAVYSIASTLQE